MNPDLAQSLLRQVLAWDDDEVNNEIPGLQTLAQYKYDDYGRFEPGDRYIERLALWLQQFDVDQRRIAFDFLKQRLVFVSEAEMRKLIRMTFPDFVVPIIREEVVKLTGESPHRIRAIEATTEFRTIQRQSLFLGLSDGARLDEFRRSATSLSNEQVYLTYQLAAERAEDMQSSLAEDLGAINPVAKDRFRLIFLVDDFAGSGTSILRLQNGKAKGRLARFASTMRELPLFDEDTRIVILLYLSTEQALDHLQEVLKLFPDPPWIETPKVVPIYRLPADARISCQAEPFDHILHEKYDEDALMNSHRGVGGDTMVHGYGDCGLSLVLAHNTPNNSIYMLWESRTGLYVPLFPRIDRHTEKN